MELSLGLNFPPLFLKIHFEERSYTDLNYSIQHLSSPYYYRFDLLAAQGTLKSLLPNQGSSPGPLHWEYGVLATGPPEKSLSYS